MLGYRSCALVSARERFWFGRRRYVMCRKTLESRGSRVVLQTRFWQFGIALQGGIRHGDSNGRRNPPKRRSHAPHLHDRSYFMLQGAVTSRLSLHYRHTRATPPPIDLPLFSLGINQATIHVSHVTNQSQLQGFYMFCLLSVQDNNTCTAFSSRTSRTL